MFSYRFSNDTDFSIQFCTRPKAARGLSLWKIPFFCCYSNSGLWAILFFVPTLLCNFPVLILSFPKTLLCTAVVVPLDKFKIFVHIHVYNAPCSGFMKKSPSISCIEKYATFTSPFLILSVTKKYLMSRWHVLQLLDVLPFLANTIVLLMS